MLTYRSHAKINLYLDVLGKRRDGYHDIETVFQSISIYDVLRLEPQRDGLTLSCSDPALSTGEDNLVIRAAQLLHESAKAQSGARMHLIKNIPLASGMAGGSGNAAAALVGLNLLWNIVWPVERLEPLARELGADVAFCLQGGTTAATGRGDILEPLPRLPETWFVLVHPPLEISSAWVYNHSLLGYRAETMIGHRTASFHGIVTSLQQIGAAPTIIFNRMERPVFSEYPELAMIKQELLQLGCTAAAMSGSGPTLFGVCRSQAEAQRIADTLAAYKTSVVQSVEHGVISA